MEVLRLLHGSFSCITYYIAKYPYITILVIRIHELLESKTEISIILFNNFIILFILTGARLRFLFKAKHVAQTTIKYCQN